MLTWNGLKAFNELQLKVLDTQNKVAVADQQITELQQKSRRKEIAQKQLQLFSPETKMYFGCGKMWEIHIVELVSNWSELSINLNDRFMSDDKSAILSRMADGVKVNSDKIKALEVSSICSSFKSL